MNIAVILAGGTGARVGATIPKQFIKVMGKPILVYTLELFQNNANIDAIEIVCHKDWVGEVEQIVSSCLITKTRWITVGGQTFQESVVNGITNLKRDLSPDDIVVISFGVSPMTPDEDINDSIQTCMRHGNGIAAKDIDLCTCIKDDDAHSTQSILRETLKGFANPWSFRFGELCEAYETALSNGMLETLEPHTTSLYFALGKPIWFSQCTSSNVKITKKEDIDVFEGYLLLKEKRGKENYRKR